MFPTASPERASVTGTTEGDGMPDVLTVPTAHGPARAHLHAPAGTPVAALVLGHGAGGGINAPDLLAATAAALDLGVAVALVEQPYRVAGKRVGPRAPTLDAAWQDVVGALTTEHVPGVPLVVGGRSAGARVACRTALASHAVGVLALAFPLQPPGRPDAPSRRPELDGAGVPALVVQGETDPYGLPEPDPGRRREVVTVPGTHTIRRTEPVREAVGPWLRRLLESVSSG